MTIAEELADLVSRILRHRMPLRIRAWDGSETGPQNSPTIHICSTTALRRLIWNPGELGLAQAYIAGDIDIIGDINTAFARLWQLSRSAGGVRLSPAIVVHALRIAMRYHALWPRPSKPTLEAEVSGPKHSRDRDREAIAFHYDLSNEFYELLLDPDLVYSCGYWTQDTPDYGLAAAQHDKLDLICRKLQLREGMRLLDIGCGWGALAIHAATHYGVSVVAVTLSQQQHSYARQRADAAGLNGQVEFRLQDYRDISDPAFDAISTVEMGEHVGKRQYPTFAATLCRLVAPTGRVLVQQMSRGANAPGGGAFIESYIAPDMHMRPVGSTVNQLERSGLEVRDVEALREHYVRTVAEWQYTLEDSWDKVVAMIGQARARVWRLYLVGGGMAFAQRRMGVDQILAVMPTTDGASLMPATRETLTLDSTT